MKKDTIFSNLIIKMINSINPHKDEINSMSIFPSGNLISVSDDKSIKIYDNNFNIIQSIENAHDESIDYVNIKDENNFVTCSKDKSIKTWIKKNDKNKENKFILNKIIKNAHNRTLWKVIYYKNLNLISCSWDKKIKIWDEIKNNNYQLITILSNLYHIWSILILEDKNLLLSSGNGGTYFYKLITYEYIFHIKEANCYDNNGLKRIDDNRIIVGGDSEIINIISISEKKIIKKIENDFRFFGIYVIQNKGIFLIGGFNDIKIYSYESYECVQLIKNAHNGAIYGFVQLNNELFVSYGNDKIIRIWSIKFLQ